MRGGSIGGVGRQAASWWIAYTWGGSVRLIPPEDGGTLYYKTFHAQGHSSIRSVPASGGTPRLLVRFDEAHQSSRPEFATDGRRLFFTLSARSGDVWSVELVGRR
jgi:hypothetical protein